MSKIGLHIVPGPRNGFGEFVRRTVGHLAVVKCVDDFGPALEVKELSSKTLTIGRIRNSHGLTNFDNAIDFRDAPEIAALNWYALAHPVWEAHREIDVWECLNEIDSHYEWQANWYIALAQLAEADGFRLGLFSCSSGTPKRPEDGDPIPYAEIARCCRTLQDRGHILSLHEYGGLPPAPTGLLRGSEPLHALRYATLASYLLDLEIYMPIVITECGQNAGGQFIGIEQFIDDFAWYDSYAMRDPWVLGVCAWTLGGGEWAGANFSEALPALADYILAHPTDEFPSPPPPAKPRGAPRIQYARIVNVIPASVGEDTATTIFVETWRGGRQTVTGSYDDAGIGDLDERRAVLWNIPDAERETYSRWYADNYPGVEVEYKDTETAPPPPPPPPPVSPPAWVGLHMAARGGPFTAGDFNCLSRARIEAVKVMSNHTFEDVERLIALGYDPGKMVLRLFADMRDKEMTAAKFFEVHRGWLTLWRSKGCRYVEVHNEPNLGAEGLGLHWPDAEGFSAYYTAVARAIRAEYPTLLIGYPGLSPNSGEIDPRSNVTLWMPTIYPLINAGLVDWIGAHSYWTTDAQMDDPAHGRYYRRFLIFPVPVLITEFSNKSTFTSHSDKGVQYVRYYKSLAQEGVKGAFAFVSSASVTEYSSEVWVSAQGAVTAIADIVGARS